MRIQGIALAALVAALTSGAGAQTTITLNTATTYQTIEGLGGFSCVKSVKVRQGPFYVDAPIAPHYDTLAYDLGVSLLRFEVTPGFQPTEGGAYDPAADVFCGPMPENIRQMREFNARGVNRFLFTVWSPPGWMKLSGSTSGPGEGSPDYNTTQSKLDPAHYADFGHFLVAYLKSVRDSSGVTPYAISLQNELRFTQTFNSCVYNGTAFVNVHRTVGPIIRTDFPNIRFAANEDLFGLMDMSWMTSLFGDAQASAYTNILAGHYGDAGGYSNAWTTANQYGKALWGSEEQLDNSAMGQAQRLHWALTGGNASGWIIWTLADLFDANRAPTPMYFGCKHYYRFVRPGAQRIGATGGGSLQVSAFKHTANATVTVVIINTGSATSVNIAGSGLPAQFYRYLTDATHNCQNMGSGALSGIAIPGNSITTLYSADVTATREDLRRAASMAPVKSRLSGPVRVYALDGRLIQALGQAAAPAGIRIEAGANGSARSVMSGW
jgi:glucuronoarabinoxylan endo-1,4-beta-xylanase